MPNRLIIGQHRTNDQIRQKKQTLFTSFDLCYAYSQNRLDKKTREQCNLSLIGGNTTGT